MGYNIFRKDGLVYAVINNTGETVEFDFQCRDIQIIRMYPYLPADPSTSIYNEILFIQTEEDKYLYINPAAFDNIGVCDLQFNKPEIFELFVVYEGLILGDFVNNMCFFLWNDDSENGWGFYELSNDGCARLKEREISKDLEMELGFYFYGEDGVKLRPEVPSVQLDAFRMFQLIDFESGRTIKKNYNYAKDMFAFAGGSTGEAYKFNNWFPTSSELGLLIPDSATIRGATFLRYQEYLSLDYSSVGDFDYKTGLAMVERQGKFAFINKYLLPVTDWFDELCSKDIVGSKNLKEISDCDENVIDAIFLRKGNEIFKILVGGDLMRMYSVKPGLFYKYPDLFLQRWEFVYGMDNYNIPVDLDDLIIPFLDVAIIESYWEYDTPEDEIEILNMAGQPNALEKKVLERIIDFQFMFRNAQKLDEENLTKALEMHRRDNGIIPCGYKILEKWSV